MATARHGKAETGTALE